MKPKHTPGPWIVIDERTTSGYPIKAIRRGDDKSVYNIAILGDRMPSAAQWLPNAQLIAAAPDLLAVAETILSFFDQHNKLKVREIDLTDLRAAVKKARGES